MNLLRRSLALFVVTIFTSQAVLPEVARASSVVQNAQAEEEFDDTEEEEEEPAEQTSKTSYFDPTYVVPVVIATIAVAATIYYKLRNQGAAAPVAAIGAGFGVLPQQPPAEQQERRPPTPFSAKGAPTHNADRSAGVMAEAFVPRTPGVTPLQRGRANVQEEARQEVAPTASPRRSPRISTAKRVAIAPDYKTPEAPSAVRVGTPMPRGQLPVEEEEAAPVVRVINLALEEQAQAEGLAMMEVDAGEPLVAVPVPAEVDEEEEIIEQTRRNAKKTGAKTAVKRPRKKEWERTIEDAAPHTAIGKRTAGRIKRDDPK